MSLSIFFFVMKPKAVVDIDGVLLDYNAGYAKHWERMFGVFPALKDPNAYWATDMWDVRILKGKELEDFSNSFDEIFWESLKPIRGAIEACNVLAEKYDIIACTTSLPIYNITRKRYLLDLGFKLHDVISTGKHPSPFVNPKATFINAIKPEFVVDDLSLGLIGLNKDIQLYLINRAPLDHGGSADSNNDLIKFSGMNITHSSLSELVKEITMNGYQPKPKGPFKPLAPPQDDNSNEKECIVVIDGITYSDKKTVLCRIEKEDQLGFFFSVDINDAYIFKDKETIRKLMETFLPTKAYKVLEFSNETERKQQNVSSSPKIPEPPPLRKLYNV